MATVGELIHRNGPEILRAWSAAAEQAVSAKNLTTSELAGLMPRYLALLAQGATEPDARLTTAQRTLIEEHLSNRLREGFDLSEMLTEFAVLGRCVSKLLESIVVEDRPSVVDVARLYAELYQTSAVVTKMFNEHLLEDEQTLKRYSRLLDGIAQDGIGAPCLPGPFGVNLEDLLEVVSDAMGGCGVALLILDATGERQTSATAVATEAQELALHARSIEASVFAGSDGIADSASGTLTVPETLRRCGVGGLLRVAHLGRSSLRCILYVAIESNRPFSASEVRRADRLTRELTIHLDNAQLHASLRDKVDELRVEREHRERVMSTIVRAIRGPLATARSSTARLLTAGGSLNTAGIEVIELLGGLERAVDDLLATTPTVRSDIAH